MKNRIRNLQEDKILEDVKKKETQPMDSNNNLQGNNFHERKRELQQKSQPDRMEK
jgi:hypothetical protein